jgi:hypothetical protein
MSEHEVPTRTTLLSSLDFVGFGLVLWGLLGIYTSFFRGSIPLTQWQTDHNIAFGILWLLLIFPDTLYQKRAVRNWFHAVGIWRHGWSVLPLASLNAVFQVCGLVIICVAWFPSPLPWPLSGFSGGFLTGGIVLVCVLPGILLCNVALVTYAESLFRDQRAQYRRAANEG